MGQMEIYDKTKVMEKEGDRIRNPPRGDSETYKGAGQVIESSSKDIMFINLLLCISVCFSFLLFSVYLQVSTSLKITQAAELEP